MTKPRVLLLGDSIRMGYQDDVKALLADRADVFFPEHNGRDTTYTLHDANQWFIHNGKVDIIHWNNGYWDMNIEAPMTEPLRPLPEYRYQLQRLIDLLKTQTKHLMFATSVPIERQGVSQDNTGIGALIHYDNQWVQDYNQAAVAVMNENQVPVDDLYKFCLPAPHYYKKADHLHLTPAGYEAVAGEIVRQITPWLKED